MRQKRIMEPYAYMPLAHNLTCTRLVKLLPDDGGPLRVTLFEITIAQAPDFDALSYWWGTVMDKVMIECDGMSLRIPPNLFDFLTSIRQLPEIPLLWVDAISIDQHSSSEARHGFSNLPEIYKTATRTLCWVGLQCLPSIKTLIATTNDSKWLQEATKICFSQPDLYHSAYKIEANRLIELEELRATIDPELWHGVDAFLSQDYFTRLWRIQDVVCSKHPVMFDGESYVRWEDLSRTVLAWTLLSPKLSLKSSSTMMVLVSEALRYSYNGAHEARSTLPDTLLAIRNCHVSAVLSIDHVVVSLSLSSTPTLMQMDYDTVAEDVYHNASIEINKLTQQPLSLSLVDLDVVHTPLSWTHDWSIPSQRFLLNHSSSTFSASTHLGGEFSTVEESGEALRVTGLLVDSIRDASSYMPPRRHCDHYAAGGDNSTFYSEWFDFAREKSLARKTDEQVLLDYANTIQARGCGHIWEYPEKTRQDRVIETQEFLNFLDEDDAEESLSVKLFFAACYPSHDRRFAITSGNRFFCLVPRATRRGDIVCILHGSRVPHILRPTHAQDTYLNVGEAYVHGLMHGEVEQIEGLEQKDIWIA